MGYNYGTIDIGLYPAYEEPCHFGRGPPPIDNNKSYAYMDIA
jgi:hypothetical protein